MLWMKIHFNELMYKSFRCPKLNLWNSSGAFFAGIPFHEKKFCLGFEIHWEKKIRKKSKKKLGPGEIRTIFNWNLRTGLRESNDDLNAKNDEKYEKLEVQLIKSKSGQRIFSIYFTVHNFPSIFLLYTDWKIIGYLMTRITTCDICDARSLLVDTTLFFQRIWLDLGYYLHTLYCKHVIQSPILTTKGVMTMRRRLVIT